MTLGVSLGVALGVPLTITLGVSLDLSPNSEVQTCYEVQETCKLFNQL